PSGRARADREHVTTAVWLTEEITGDAELDHLPRLLQAVAEAHRAGRRRDRRSAPPHGAPCPPPGSPCPRRARPSCRSPRRRGCSRPGWSDRARPLTTALDVPS